MNSPNPAARQRSCDHTVKCLTLLTRSRRPSPTAESADLLVGLSEDVRCEGGHVVSLSILISYVEGSPSPFSSSFVLPLTLPRPEAHQAAFSYPRSTSVPAPWLSAYTHPNLKDAVKPQDQGRGHTSSRFTHPTPARAHQSGKAPRRAASRTPP